MTLFREKYRIESARLKHWDYSSAGYYFITICTKDRDNLFGEIENGEMILNNFGKNTEEQWQKSFSLRQELQCDEYIIMPDHIHAIIIITENPTSVETHGVRLKNKHDINHKNDMIPADSHGVRLKNTPDINHNNDPIPVETHGVRLINDGDACHASLQDRRQEQDPKIFRRPKSVSSFVAGFKSSVTRIYNKKNNTKGRAIWQPRFHDRVIRNEIELQKIRNYIKTNPIKW
ncbi:MAG: transposase, partial [bacterium]